MRAFAFQKLGYAIYREMLPGEIVKITSKRAEVLSEGHINDLKICTFLWTYYGYPNSVYEGVTVETMRTRNGEIMAEHDIQSGNLPDVDFICGVPDSGVPHAIGYANRSGIPFARPFIKYTPTWPRSFMPQSQSMRNKVAKMKLIPVHELIEGKKLLFVDDSIVRGTQLRETVEFLYANGAKEVHMRSACPPIMYGCKYLNFSRSTSELDLIARRIIHEFEGAGRRQVHRTSTATPTPNAVSSLRSEICKRLKLTSLEFQSLEGTVKCCRTSLKAGFAATAGTERNDPNCLTVIYTRNAAYSAFTVPIRRPTWRTADLFRTVCACSTEVRKAAASLSTTAACSDYYKGSWTCERSV